MEKINQYRIAELDALRGIAAVSVVLFHYTTFYRSLFGHDFPEKYDFEYGHYGVALFFMISGFVIFMSLKKITSIGDFAYKRFCRLYPTYWICLILTLVVLFVSSMPSIQPTVKQSIVNFSMFQNLLHVKDVDVAYWSLLPELMFYIGIAVIYKLNLLSKILWIGIFWLVLMVAATFRASIFDMLLNLKFGMFFLAGIVFYRIRYEKTGILEHLVLLLCLASIYFVKGSVEYLLFSAAFFGIFYLIVYQKLTFLDHKILLFLGNISYPLYLLHTMIGFVIIFRLKAAGVNEIPAIAVAIATSILLAWLVFQYAEAPLLKLMRRKTSKPAVAAASQNL